VHIKLKNQAQSTQTSTLPDKGNEVVVGPEVVVVVVVVLVVVVAGVVEVVDKSTTLLLFSSPTGLSGRIGSG
jgi:hypothetical protein